MHVTKILGLNGVSAYRVSCPNGSNLISSVTKLVVTYLVVTYLAVTELVEVTYCLFQIDFCDDGIMVGVADAGDGVGDGTEMRRVKNVVDADERPEE